MLFPHHLKLCVVAAGCIGNVSAGFSFINWREAPVVPTIVAVPHERKATLEMAMVNIQQALSSVSTMPTCKKLAAQDLLYSCEVFEDRRGAQNGRGSEQRSGDEVLESFENLYAIRVTNCEHRDANDALPGICEPLLESEHRKGAPIPGINKCLEAMNSDRPTQWVTYNRIKLEGLFMCHSIRVETDKDDMIYLYKVLSDALTNVNGALLLQKDEMETLVGSLVNIGTQARAFQNSLYRDNQEIKAEMKGFSNELKGSMTNINEQTHAMLQQVSDFQSRLSSAIEVAKKRSEQTDVQLAAQVETHQQNLDLLHDKSGFAMQKMMEAFHSYALNVSQSVEIANSQTSILARKIEDVTFGLDAPIRQLAEVKSAVNEVADTVLLMQTTSNETLVALEKTAEFAGGFLSTMEAMISRIAYYFYNISTLAFYFLAVFTATFIFWAHNISRSWAFSAAAIIASYLSFIFTTIHSPVAYAYTILSNHPVIFSPAIWSVLVSIATGILLGEAARRIYHCFVSATNVDYQSRLPVDEHEAMDSKV